MSHLSRVVTRKSASGTGVATTSGPSDESTTSTGNEPTRHHGSESTDRLLPRRQLFQAAAVLFICTILLTGFIGDAAQPGFFEAAIALLTTSVGLLLAAGAVLIERNDVRFAVARRHLVRWRTWAIGLTTVAFTALTLIICFNSLTTTPGKGEPFVTAQRAVTFFLCVILGLLAAIGVAALRLTQPRMVPRLLRARALDDGSSTKYQLGIIADLEGLALDDLEHRELTGFSTIVGAVADIGVDPRRATNDEPYESALNVLKHLYSQSAYRRDFGIATLDALRRMIDEDRATGPHDVGRPPRLDHAVCISDDLVTTLVAIERPSNRQVTRLLDLLRVLVDQVTGINSTASGNEHIPKVDLSTVGNAIVQFGACRLDERTPADVATSIDELLPATVVALDDPSAIQRIAALATVATSDELVRAELPLQACMAAILQQLVSDDSGHGLWRRTPWSVLMAYACQVGPPSTRDQLLEPMATIVERRLQQKRRQQFVSDLVEFIDDHPESVPLTNRIVTRSAAGGAKLRPRLLRFPDEAMAARWLRDVSADMTTLLRHPDDGEQGTNGDTRSSAKVARVLEKRRRSLVTALTVDPATRPYATMAIVAVLEAVSHPSARPNWNGITWSTITSGRPRPNPTFEAGFFAPGLEGWQTTAYETLLRVVNRLSAFRPTDDERDQGDVDITEDLEPDDPGQPTPIEPTQPVDGDTAEAALSPELLVATIMICTDLLMVLPSRDAMTLVGQALDVLGCDTPEFDTVVSDPKLGNQLLVSLTTIAALVAGDDPAAVTSQGSIPSPTDESWEMVTSEDIPARLADIWLVRRMILRLLEDQPTIEPESVTSAGEQSPDHGKATSGTAGDDEDVESSEQDRQQEIADFQDLEAPDESESAEAGNVLVTVHAAVLRAARSSGGACVNATLRQRDRIVGRLCDDAEFRSWWDASAAESFWDEFLHRLREASPSTRSDPRGLPWSTRVGAAPVAAEVRVAEHLASALLHRSSIDFDLLPTLLPILIERAPESAAAVLDRVIGQAKRRGPNAERALWMTLFGSNLSGPALAFLAPACRLEYDRRCTDGPCRALAEFNSMRWKTVRSLQRNGPPPPVEAPFAWAALTHVMKEHPDENFPPSLARRILDSSRPSPDSPVPPWVIDMLDPAATARLSAVAPLSVTLTWLENESEASCTEFWKQFRGILDGKCTHNDKCRSIQLNKRWERRVLDGSRDAIRRGLFLAVQRHLADHHPDDLNKRWMAVAVKPFPVSDRPSDIDRVRRMGTAIGEATDRLGEFRSRWAKSRERESEPPLEDGRRPDWSKR